MKFLAKRNTDLLLQEMESGTEEERITFEEAVDKFAAHWSAAQVPTGKRAKHTAEAKMALAI